MWKAASRMPVGHSRVPVAHAPTHEPEGSDEVRGIDLPNAPATDETGWGLETTDTVGENVIAGQILSLKSDGKYWLADADSFETMPAEVMAMEDILANAEGRLLHIGYFRRDDWAWVPGDGVANLLYASVTPGAMSQDKPVGAGDQTQVVSYVRDEDRVFFNPSYELEVNVLMEQVLFGGIDDLLDTAATEYNSLIGGESWRPAESDYAKLVSIEGKIKNLRVRLNGAPGAGTRYTFTLMVNGAPSALTFDIADAATSGSNMLNEIDVTSGDTVSLRCVPTGPPIARNATWTSVFEGYTANESLILGGTFDTLNSGVTEYGQVMCAFASLSITEPNSRQVVPTSGTIKNLYVKLSADPGTAPDAYKFTLRKGGVNQALTVTITADDTTGSDLINTVDVVAGDILTMMFEPLNTPSATPKAKWSMTFVADTDGESIVMGGSLDAINAADTEYMYLTGREGFMWTADESLRYQLGQVCKVKKLHILLDGSPGAGTKYDFTIRIAGADSNVVATISDAATTGNSGALEDTVDLDEYVDLECEPTNTPTARDAYWGFVCVPAWLSG